METHKSQIRVDQIGIGKLLKDFTLAVPSHQRDFSWTDLEVKTLLQDLAKSISDGDSAYFLGTIVTLPAPGGKLEVIDGQQRLATITILLCEMRRHLIDKERLIADDISSFLWCTDRMRRAVVPRLTLNRADNDFFRCLLTDDQSAPQVEPTLKSHTLIRAAFREISAYVRKIVAGFDVKAHGDILNKWINFIESGAEVILLQVPTGGNAYKMFETLNDRGLKTTQADLVKNYLFSQAAERLTEAEHSWSVMRGALESLQEEDREDITVTFLRHALMAIQGFLRKGEVYEAVQRNAKGSQGAISLLGKTSSLSAPYVATFYRDHEIWNDHPDAVRSAIHVLNTRLDIHPFRPVLLAVAAKFEPKEALKSLELLISLGVRLLVASSTRSGSVEETLAKATHRIFIGKAVAASDLRHELRDVIPSDEKFRQAFETATVSSGPLARYYLRTLEKVSSGTDPLFTLSDDKEVVTLEHILPRNPEGNWPQFTPEEVEAYWRRIGNMVLLHRKLNSDLKSAAWSTKRQHFRRYKYALTAQVAGVQEWNVEAICERQTALAKLALKAWSI